MAYAILNSKLVAERITVTFSFINELAPLEVIVSQVVTVEVLVGEDPEPDDLLFLTAGTDGQVVSQQIHQGVPGVIYQLICTVETDIGQTVQKISKLAILPTLTIIPDIFGTRYTTPPYPVEAWEDTTHGMSFQTGKLRPIPTPFDYATHGIGFVSGTMRDLLIRFNATREDVTHGIAFVDGELRDLLITFDAGEDSVESGVNFISGTMEDKLIDYSTLPDETTVGIQFVSGTLT